MCIRDSSSMLADESRTIQDLFKEMVGTDHSVLLREIFPKAEGSDAGAKAHTFIASSAREMLNKAENEASGVVSTALTNLALYRDPVVALNTASCDFRIHDLMNHEKPVSYTHLDVYKRQRQYAAKHRATPGQSGE